MHKKVDGDHDEGWVNISRLSLSVWPNLPYERIYFDMKIPLIPQPSETL